MKRFHVHLHVDDIDANIRFYAKLFGAQPTRVEADYAKWMLDDPRINFAISTRGDSPGLGHLGFQTDDADELAELKARAESADIAMLDEGETTCCYARSDKYWVTDPQGVAWEQFHTLGDIPIFGKGSPRELTQNAASGCCAPTGSTPVAKADTAASSAQGSSCGTPATRGKPLGIAVTSAAPKSSCC